MKLDIRYGNNPTDSARYNTEELRRNYLVEQIFVPGEIRLAYSHQDRIVFGGITPLKSPLKLDTSKELAADFFLQRREAGIINIGGAGVITADGKSYVMNQNDGLYLGMGTKDVVFSSANHKEPAKFYLNSAPAHASYPSKHIPLEAADKVTLGDIANANRRTINRYVHPNVCKSCQLTMGMTIFEEGSIWNTMPCHTHDRRMEVYLYFNVKPDHIVFHFMGTKEETRHIVMKNEQAVISPSWSIHAGAGTSSYTFIWGMCGENQVFEDMDHIKNEELK